MYWLDLLIDPAALLFVALVLLFGCRLVGGRFDWSLLVIIGLSWSLGAITLVAPLMYQWEKRASALVCQRTPSTWVLLGGGVTRTGQRSPFPLVKLSTHSQLRLQQGWQKLLQAPKPVETLWLSGSLEADLLHAVLEQAAKAQGVQLRRDSAATTTWETAAFFAGKRHREPLGIITSAVHMPRTLLAFERFGVPACALPVDTQGARRARWVFVPQSTVLEKAGQLVHEWIGTLYYRWRSLES